MSFHIFTREQLLKVVDTDDFIEFEKEFYRLFPHAVSLNQNNDRYDPNSWCFTGYCAEMAVLVTYPIVKKLYPEMKFKLYVGREHTAIVNDAEDIIFDFISAGLGLSTDFLYSTDTKYPDPVIIQEEDISEWWTTEILGGRYDCTSDLIADLL